MYFYNTCCCRQACPALDIVSERMPRIHKPLHLQQQQAVTMMMREVNIDIIRP